MGTLKSFWRGFSTRLRKESATPADLPEEVRRVSARGDVIKEPPMEIDGRVMGVDEFVRYVEGLQFAPPLPTRIFLHHTWKPTPETWRGRSTILGMKAYYEKQLWTDSQGRVHEGWTAGPHLFIAPDGIWLFSDLRYDGVGVYGHNYRTRHIEMVGDFDASLPSGAVLDQTVAALGILHERLGLDIRKLNFHRDFSDKTCPGRAVTKEWIIPKVAAWIEEYRRKKATPEKALRQTLTEMIQDMLVPTNPQTALVKEAAARGLLGALTNEIPMEIDDQGYIVQFFAQALLVPVNEWNKVRSLHEHETQTRGAAVSPASRAWEQAMTVAGDEAATEAGESAEGEEQTPDYLVAPPVDPYDFQGEIR
ncbi:MAG: N-acetylmuramoyl-L-alanine amidase [Chloroflexi bacterium]|nr:N-acetylmuramoyl-L-alanine amidase [Chloroflexota bacterium]